MPRAGKYDYPIFDLDSCIEKMIKFYQVLKSYEAERKVIAETLGMKALGGGFAYLISAMEKYGLIDTGQGKVVITDLGKTILHGESDEVAKAKSEAVQRLEIFNDMFEMYGVDVTEEQIRAFLRQKANAEIGEAQKTAPKIVAIYKRVSKYIKLAKTPARPSLAPPSEGGGVGRRETITPPEFAKSEPLKIQYGDVYIQVPPDDPKAIALAIDALKFMQDRIKLKTKRVEGETASS